MKKIVMAKNTLRTLLVIILGVGEAVINTVHAQQQETPRASITIIQPEKTVKKSRYAAIDTERFELGAYFGRLSVEDFGSNSVTGLSFSYHINPRFLLQLHHAKADVANAAFEDALGRRFVSDSDREFSYTSTSVGYRIFHGRSFLGARNKFNSNIYLMAGLDSIDFAGSTNTGLVLATSYKIVVTDWLTWNIDLRDHIVERDFLADKKITQNIELALGFNLLF